MLDLTQAILQRYNLQQSQHKQKSQMTGEDTSSGTDTGDSEGEGADSEGEGTEVNTPTSEELNLIVNVGCLQTIIGRLACPECHKTLLMVREGGKDFRPKERWASLQTVDTALGIAVQKFNQGSTALLNILLELELMQNTRAAEYGEQEDVKRVNKATRRSSQQAQEKRKKIDDIRRRERQAFLAREGPAYGAGEY
ncbi:hypothetical protein ACOMHN_035915 [Nucella lapillus]